MKTTIDIADNILAQARRLARRENQTLRTLVEQGLRHMLTQDAVVSRRTRVKPVTVAGKGMRPEFRAAGWETIRNAAYEGHGG